MLGDIDPWPAYCLDNAVATFGNAVESALNSVEGKTDKEINRKRERELRKWLGMPAQFRNPVGPIQG